MSCDFKVARESLRGSTKPAKRQSMISAASPLSSAAKGLAGYFSGCAMPACKGGPR
jgi:hypothetical protein